MEESVMTMDLFYNMRIFKQLKYNCMNKKTTSPRIASLASETLLNPQSSDTAKTLAASALSQASKNKESSDKVEQLASHVLNSPKYSEETKELAGSVLSQSNK